MAKTTFIASKYRTMLVGGTVMAVLVSVLIMADTLISGIFLGEDAVAGVNLMLPLYSLISFFSMMVSLGVPILYANKTGAFQRKEADHVFCVGFMMSIIAGIVLFLLLLLFGDAYLCYYQPDGQVLYRAREYLYWMKYVALIMPAEELLFGMVYADGDEVISTIGNVLSAVSKVLLSGLLCKSMGTRGLALATFIGLLISLAILSLHFLRKRNSLRLRFSAFSLDFEMVRSIVKYSIVDAGTYLFLFLFTTATNLFVIRVFGTDLLILVSAITLVREAQMVFDGIGETITPILSVYLGEENYPGVREVWGLARRTAHIESVIVSVLLIIFAPYIVGMLHIESPGTAHLACLGLRILSVTMIFTCHLYLDSSYDILADKTSLGILVGALRDVVVPLPFAVVGGLAFGVCGMFIGLMLSQPVSYLLAYWYIRARYGRENYPLFLAEKEKGKKMKLYEFEVAPVSVVTTRDRIGETLTENGYPGGTVHKTMLLFEEVFMAIYERNDGRRVRAECSVEMGERVRLITKDDGTLFDLTNVDRKVDSLREYVVSMMIGSYVQKRVHFLALSFNRNSLEIG